MGYRSTTLLAAFLLASQQAGAAVFTAEITDQNGKPAANSVISLMPEARANMPAASTRLAMEKTIDQNHETFIPLVTILPKGGRIIFSNADTTTHQVYSFSPIKRFELTVSRDQKSAPVVFDTAGVAALGCNIHDNMIAYAYVADSPWTALTGADGKAQIADVPPGQYEVTVWNPRLPPGREQPSSKVTVTGETAKLTTSIRVLPPPMPHMHGGDY